MPADPDAKRKQLCIVYSASSEAPKQKGEGVKIKGKCDLCGVQGVCKVTGGGARGLQTHYPGSSLHLKSQLILKTENRTGDLMNHNLLVFPQEIKLR